jgi:hypothetical protein
MYKEDDNDYVSITFHKVIKETDAAILIELSDNPFSPIREWIPKSQILGDWDENVIEIPRWLAEKKGL